MFCKFLVLLIFTILGPNFLWGQLYFDEVSLPNRLRCADSERHPEIALIDVERTEYLTNTYYPVKANQRIVFDQEGKVDYVHSYQGKVQLDSITFSYQEGQLKWIKKHTGDAPPTIGIG